MFFSYTGVLSLTWWSCSGPRKRAARGRDALPRPRGCLGGDLGRQHQDVPANYAGVSCAVRTRVSDHAGVGRRCLFVIFGLAVASVAVAPGAGAAVAVVAAVAAAAVMAVAICAVTFSAVALNTGRATSA